jgi:RNAse (barnase) inhibitor barstar
MHATTRGCQNQRMLTNPLLSATPPWVLVADFRSQAFEESLGELRAAGGEVISLDGARARNSDALFDHVAEAAKFPEYFGRNWPAFDECLADLEWLPATCYAVILENPERLLENEPLSRPVFARLFAGVAAEWVEEDVTGEDWDRPSTAFHLVADLSGAGTGGPRPLGENEVLAWLSGPADAVDA